MSRHRLYETIPLIDFVGSPSRSLTVEVGLETVNWPRGDLEDRTPQRHGLDIDGTARERLTGSWHIETRRIRACSAKSASCNHLHTDKDPDSLAYISLPPIRGL